MSLFKNYNAHKNQMGSNCFAEKNVRSCSGLPQSGKNIWKMTFFPGQGKVREFCGWPGKFRKDLESQGKVREFENKGMTGSLQKIYSVQEGKV